MSEPKKRKASWTVSGDLSDPCYYFAPDGRRPGPYLEQRHVRAIIDIADDGTLAGIELIDDMPPPPAADQSNGE